jgi:hypothetical protein
MPDARPRPGVYSVHPGVEATRQWVATLREKTGRSLEEWIELVRREGPPREADRRAWLKSTHKLGTNSAWWIAERAEGKGAEADDPAAYLRAAETWVETMYGGRRAHLRAAHDALVGLARSLGPEIRICPCQTIVPIYRNHVIAQIKPSTNTRIDFGLALGERPAQRRLIVTGGFAKKDRITHRIPVRSADEIDDEVARWLRMAFDLDG